MKLVCMLRTYRTCNSTVGFSKYEFNNKLLGSVIYIYVCVCVYVCMYMYIVEFLHAFCRLLTRIENILTFSSTK